MAAEIPDTMKAIALDRFGGPEVIGVKDVPVPEPADDEILIRVEAAGVGVWDPWEREGGMAEMLEGAPRFPYIPGSDGAGEVVAVGADVTRFEVGDRVYAFGFGNPKGGLYAEYAALPARNAARIPKGMSVEQAAALAVDGITALTGLDQLGSLAGKRVMIAGASGGVGHLALQLARRMGAKVLALASRADGLELVRRLGADAAAEGHDRDAVLEACREFAPDGLDGALVLACDDTVQAALRTVKRGGRIAHPNGVEPAPKGAKGVEVIAYDGIPDEKRFDRLNTLIEAGPFHLEIDHLYPIEEATEAYEAVQKHHIGKLAMQIH